jgi:hypothetical protein
MDEFTMSDQEARRRGHALAMLRLRWHHAYGITWEKDDSEFVAHPRDGSDALRNNDAEKLNDDLAVREDTRPVASEFYVMGLFQP